MNKKAGKKSKKSEDYDDDNNDDFIIKNNDNSIVIGNSDYGNIAFNGTKLLRGDIRCITVGTSGSGKSYLTRNMIEEFYRSDMGIVIVIDPEGEYWTLREKYDFVILGTDEDFCDILISEDNAADLAILTMKNRISIIIDLAHNCDDKNKQLIASIFIDSLMNNSRYSQYPIQLIIEEASKFARRGDSSQSNIKCTNSLKKTAMTGRKRKISTFYNTQRITQLHKDIIAECQTKLLGKIDDVADINRNSINIGIKDGSVFRKLNYEFFAYGPGFDHTEKAIKFRSNRPNSQHLSDTYREIGSHPKPNNRIKEWISLMNGKSIQDILKADKIEQKQLTEPIQVLEVPKKSFEEIENDKIKDIVKYLGKINLSDLYVLLNRDGFNEIASRFEFNIFCKTNSEFKLNEDTLYYLDDDTDSTKLTSEFVIKSWKEKIKDYDYCKILTYLYEMNNDRNKIEEIEKSLGIRKESIMIACNTFESLNLTKIINNSIYLNAILFFDKDSNNFEDFEEMNFVDNFNEDDDDFFNKDDD